MPKVKRDPELLIWIETEKLSDGSEVFNVALGAEKFAAVDESAAEALAEAFRDAINENTDTLSDIVRQ